MNETQLKRMNLENEDISTIDLILAKRALAGIDAEFQQLGVNTPEWVSDKLGNISSEIVRRNRTELEKKLRAAKARRSALATRDEKIKSLDSDIEVLEQKLSQ